MVKITAKAGEGGRLFGAVTAKEISEALAEQHQVEIAKTKLVLDEPIKACGGYQIRAKLGYERVELMDTTDGSFMTPKEAKRLMLRGSTLLVGRK